MDFGFSKMQRAQRLHCEKKQSPYIFLWYILTILKVLHIVVSFSNTIGHINESAVVEFNVKIL